MIKSKKLNLILAISLLFALAISIIPMAWPQCTTASQTKTQPQYASKLFGTDIISIEIVADAATWQTMLNNATSEEYIMADVVVNGTRFSNVGIRPKGNSSLTQVAQSDSNRYSFRLQFDEYIKDQTCFGLKSFVVNNMLGDNTYMKEYVSYALMQKAGIETPYFNYANIKVNGEAWGLYLAIELYNDSYEQRVFSDTSGMLYNVKNDMGGGQGNQDKEQLNFGDQPPALSSDDKQAMQKKTDLTDRSDKSADSAPQINRQDQGNRGGGAGAGNSGGALQYQDDSSSNYSAIFNNVVGKGSEEDYQRIITALKALSEGSDLESYWNIDEILRYFAAHTIVVNLDSYSSSMAQNYYLYEKDGVVSVLPWDYNLAWGGFQSGSASSVINFPIDTPVSGIEMSARPLLEKLFSNTEYLEKYHTYLQQLIHEYFADGQFESTIRELQVRISQYVQEDPTAFCTYEEYTAAVDAFITLGNLRAESVQGQLDGTVPSTTEAQTANPEQLIPAQDLNLTTLGTMGGGNKADGMQDDGSAPTDRPNNPFGGNQQMPDMQLMRQAMTILQQAGGTVTDEVKQQLLDLGLTEAQITMLSQMQGQCGTKPSGQNNSSAAGGNTSDPAQAPNQNDGNAPPNSSQNTNEAPPQMPQGTDQTNNTPPNQNNGGVSGGFGSLNDQQANPSDHSADQNSSTSSNQADSENVSENQTPANRPMDGVQAPPTMQTSQGTTNSSSYIWTNLIILVSSLIILSFIIVFVSKVKRNF